MKKFIPSVNVLLKGIFCRWFGHDLRFVREIKKGVVEKRCKRCGKLWAFGYGKRVEVTEEVKKLHDEILIREYLNG